MRQRLALARAYAVKPEFLLMDEPFGALDAQTRTRDAGPAAAGAATEGKTVMLITHSVDEAIYLSSRIVVVTARPARMRDDHRRAVRLSARRGACTRIRASRSCAPTSAAW